ncbi:MAG: hypothetical protein JW963_05260 [Anaerolineales bacterium]|nr:hypothetical protein [Anaerolineales bacterium]
MFSPSDTFVTLLTEHISRRPAMGPRDVYKLLYQGVRGPEHLISSPQAFREYLAAEWQALTPAGDDPLHESIRPDGSLLRLNLRPFKAAGGSLEVLTAACLETARRPWGTQDELQQAWACFVDFCKAGSWPSLALQELETFTPLLRENNFPPVHHSERYRELYQPAYRLLAVDFELRPHN